MSSNHQKGFAKKPIWGILVYLFVLLLAFMLFSNPAAGQGVSREPGAAAGIWYDVAESSIRSQEERLIIPDKYRVVGLDVAGLQTVLLQAPLEGTAAAQNSAVVLSLPLPDGGYGRFQIVESPVMAPELAAKFPDIKTYAGQGLDDLTATVRFDLTPAGFHAMILSVGGTIYIDPYARGNTENYISYYKKDFTTDKIANPLPPLDPGGLRAKETADLIAAGVVTPSGSQLRTYRLAVAATGEYTAFHGGTVAGALAAITTTINRVTGIYELEVAVRLTLIANNNLIIYTNAGTDPYTNGNDNALIVENQANLDNIIGSANYDVGHVVATGNGGLASLGIICNNASKGRGTTGSDNPVGDPFDVDFVAHELGHQFAGNHTFNGTTGSCSGNGNPSTAYEPGSGTTIQAYAGICSPQNTQGNSSDYFHTISFDEIIAHTTAGGGNTCAVITNTGNGAPVPNANSAGINGKTIPLSTPFTLTGSATDPNGQALTYNWEQFDLGPAGHPNTPVGNAPIFRSFPATTSPSRTFPQISDIVNNTQTIGEILPTYARGLTFRLTARDNQALGGGVDHDQIAITVTDTAGPFLVTAPNTAVTWDIGTNQNVTWNVANTTAAPVSCPTVNILLSTDGGFTYPINLATAVANDGTESIIVPNNPSATARVKVACANNIFFDISNVNFIIQPAGGPTCTTYASTDVPKAISTSGTPTVTSLLNVATAGIITDLNVLNLNGTHSYFGDLDFKLTSPNNTNVQIMNQSCNDTGYENFNLNLDDEATPGAWPCPPIGGGTYQPNNPLSAFDGQSSNGTWTLTVKDNADQDGGSLNGWSLQICALPTCTAPGAVTTLAATPNVNGTAVDLTWTATGADAYEVHRGTNSPYFMPSGATLLATINTNNYSDAGGLGNVANNYGYVIVAKNNCGATATLSNRVGEFDFSIVQGTP